MELRILALLIWVGVSSSGVVAQRNLNALPHSPLGSGKTLSAKDVASSPALPQDPSRHAKIMKQINKVNDDGSYTFGYEADDGSFRVETRTKDGVVKGKYGYLDANGQLKVMEYTAGEKVEGEDEELPEEIEESAPRRLPQSPQIRRAGGAVGAGNTPIPNFRPLPLSPAGPARQSRPLPTPQVVPAGTVPLGRSAASFDQSIAAQTPTQTSLTQQVPQPRQRPEEEREEADEDQPEDDDEESNRDVNNGQYFRSVSSPQQGGGGGRPTAGPGQGQDEGPRYVPTHPGPSQGFSGFPSQYAPQSPQSQRPGPPQGFSTLGQQGPQQHQGFPITAYPGGQFEDDERNGNGLGFGGAGGQPGQPQFGGRPNVNVQFRGSPPSSQQSSPYGGRPTQNPLLLQSPYSQGGFGGPQEQSGQGFPQQQFTRDGSGRALSQPGQVEDQQERYVPNEELDGYSEDADEDGYVDQPPSGGLKGQAQEKQGVSVQPGGRVSPTSGPYAPTILGPQGVLQGGRVDLDGRIQAQRPQSQQPTLGLGGQGQPIGQNPFFAGGGSSAPTLTQEQFQQFLQQQNEQFNGTPQQGLSQQAFQQQQGQVPGRGAFGGNAIQSQQGGLFGQQPQPQFVGAGGALDRQRPGQFQGQQNSFLQGQGQGQQFAGFPQLPQQQQQFESQGPQGLQRPGGQGQFLGGQSGQFLGQDGQGAQGQFLGQPGFQGQFLGQDEQSQFLGQSGQGQFLGGQGGGLPQGFQSSGGQGGGLPQGFQSAGGQNGGFQSGGRPSGGGLQSSGFPFDFSPFGGLPGQFQGGSPGQSQFGQGQGLSPSQLQALQGQGLSGGGPSQFQQGFPPGSLQGQQQQQGGLFQQQGGLFSPGQPGQFGQSPSVGSYVPGRFPGGLQQQQIPQLSLGGGQSSVPQGQRSLGQSIQLGGGPRPVQSGSSGSSSTVLGGDARKQLSSSGSSSSLPSGSSNGSKPSN